MSTDTAARQAVEGVPCYMYGIRAPEDEFPEDVVQAAREVMDDISLNDASATPAIARAILAERKRCAAVARSMMDGQTWCEWAEGWESACVSIAEEIESGQ